MHTCTCVWQDIFPTGYITSGDFEWVAPPAGPIANQTYTVSLGNQSDPGKGMYINYTVGLGGLADRYFDGRSFWASSDFKPAGRWNEMHLRSPAGLAYGSMLPRAPYKDLSQLVVRSWREHRRGIQPPHPRAPHPFASTRSTSHTPEPTWERG